MYEGILRNIRILTRAGAYRLSSHAEGEAYADGLALDDLEHALLHGYVVERQKDLDSGEWKYLVEGPTLTRGRVVVVAKIAPRGTLFLVTVYRLTGGN
ncbi:MAG: DUF4258 domain-containing protein [Planctomycetota bacterium]